MSVLRDIGDRLDAYVWNLLGEELVHTVAGEFLQTSYEPQNPHFDDIDSVVHSSDLFASWLWFDYRHDGKSMIEHFQASQPKLSSDQHVRLDQMVRTHFVSLFQVGKIKPGNIELIDLRSGVVYHVREYALASQVNAGQLMMLRVCQQVEHWEIITPNEAMLPFTLEDETLLHQLIEALPEHMTIRDTTGYAALRHELGLDDSAEKQPLQERKQMTKKAARAQLIKRMAETGADRFVSPETIMRLLDEEFAGEPTPLYPPVGVRVLFGLISGTEQEVEQLAMAGIDYWNAHVKRLGANQRTTPDAVIDTFDPYGWMQRAEDAHRSMVSNQIEEAARIYDDVFTLMLEQRLVTPSVYRLITNAAIAQLALGKTAYGQMLLTTAQRMCPDYDMAWKQQELLETGYYDAFWLQNAAGEVGERAQSLHDWLGPAAEVIARYSDEQLLNEFLKRGVSTDQKSFAAMANHYDSEYDLAEYLTNNNDDHIDAVCGLLDEARDRWAPDVVWTETLHSAAMDYVESFHDDTVTKSKRTNNMRVRANVLVRVLRLASDAVVRQWMNDTVEYATYRTSFVLAAIEIADMKPRKIALERASDELGELALSRTGDPIFTVPALIAEIPKISEAVLKERLVALAKQLPYDCESFLTIGEYLVDHKQYERAIVALEQGISTLDVRRRKKLLQNPPYSYESISESYENFGDLLDACYKATGRTNDLQKLEKKRVTVRNDESLAHNEVTDRLAEEIHKIGNEQAGDSAILRYLEWFDTLDINLSDGDGVK